MQMLEALNKDLRGGIVRIAEENDRALADKATLGQEVNDLRQELAHAEAELHRQPPVDEIQPEPEAEEANEMATIPAAAAATTPSARHRFGHWVIAGLATCGFLAVVAGVLYGGMMYERWGHSVPNVSINVDSKTQDLARITSERDQFKADLGKAQADLKTAAAQKAADLALETRLEAAEGVIRDLNTDIKSAKAEADKSQAEAKRAKAELADAKQMQVSSDYGKWSPDVRTYVADALCRSYGEKIGDGKLADQLGDTSKEDFLAKVLGSCMSSRVAGADETPPAPVKKVTTASPPATRVSPQPNQAADKCPPGTVRTQAFQACAPRLSRR